MSTLLPHAHKDVILALTIAIAAENQVIACLEQDPLAPFHQQAITERLAQIQKFEKLVEKLRKQ
jgi:hypothetical protein